MNFQLRAEYENHAILRYSLSNLCGTKLSNDMNCVEKKTRFGTEIEPNKITKTMSNVNQAPSAIQTLV